MKNFLFASVASVTVSAFMSAPLETVTVVGQDGNPLRINKSDYDADQAEGGAKRYELHDDSAPQAIGAGAVFNLPPGVSQPAAPAAPTTVQGDIDANKGAVAPTAPSLGQKLVQMTGTGKNAKYFVVTAAEGGAFPKLTGVAGIDENGYKTDKEAWDAIMSLPS